MWGDPHVITVTCAAGQIISPYDKQHQQTCSLSVLFLGTANGGKQAQEQPMGENKHNDTWTFGKGLRVESLVGSCKKKNQISLICNKTWEHLITINISKLESGLYPLLYLS